MNNKDKYKLLMDIRHWRYYSIITNIKIGHYATNNI